VELYKKGDGHVEVLSASIRNMDHFLYSIALGADILTVPFKIVKEWAELGLPMPDESYKYNVESLKPISYQDLDLNKPWQEFNIQHDLTDKGIEKFAADWNALISD
jgi:transaldolase